METIFKVGQKVVCKNVDGFMCGTYNPEQIEKGKIYTIKSINKCICGRTLLELDEVQPTNRYCGHTTIPIGFNACFYAFRFELLKYDIVSNKEIIKEIITEKLDLYIESPVEKCC